MYTRELEAGTKLPSTDPFSRLILTWDFHRDITDDRSANIQAEQELLRKAHWGAVGTKENLKIGKLPTRFQNESDYINRMLPLLLIETKQQIFRSKEMEIGDPEIVVQTRAEAVNNFIQVSLVRASASQNSRYFAGDLALLYLDPPDDDETKIPALDNPSTCTPLDPNVPNPFTTLCIIETSVSTELVVKVVIPKVNRTNERDVFRVSKIAEALNSPSQRWYFVRLMGMNTVNREYQALMSIPDIQLKDDILLTGEDPLSESYRVIEQLEERCRKVQTLPPNQRKVQMKRLMGMIMKRKRRIQRLRQRAEAETKPTLEIPKELMAKLEGLYNESQLSALRDCLKAEGITLIQGPPGTGKTTTIVGVLSVILNAQVKHVRQKPSSPADASTNVSDDETNQESITAAFAEAQPWLYDSDYSPWYDDQTVCAEDLETFICLQANKTDAIIDMSECVNEDQPQRVLVCAPSNAAVDEILRRLTRDPEIGGGVFDEKGERYNPPVVRIGANFHRDLAAHSLDQRTTARVQALGSVTASVREAIKMSIIAESRVVCSTLSVCGCREMIAFPGDFDTVVIDEASQGIEVSTLLPLKLGCKRLILVGDPKQLPATVFSRLALLNGYDQSLFQRLEAAGHKVNMLSVQYRMHPTISAFPSQVFYDGNLLDAPNIAETVSPPVPWHDIPMFKPVTFFSLSTTHSKEATSLVNHDEANFACQLVDLLRLMFTAISPSDTTWPSKIAVISPYAEQVQLIRRLLSAQFKVSSGKQCPIDVNTVDGFQGREKDLVIFSAVRAEIVSDEVPTADLKTNVGFLADIRRMNVALTRARYNLWVLGNAHFLRGNPEWRKFIHHAEKNNALFTVSYDKIPRDGFVKRWFSSYLKRAPQHKELLATHVPLFLENLERDVIMLIATAQNDLTQMRDDEPAD